MIQFNAFEFEVIYLKFDDLLEGFNLGKIKSN